MSEGAVTWHLAPADYYEGLDPDEPYIPEDFAREGFIHCTDGIEELVRVANRYYRADPRPYVILEINPKLVRAEIRYEDSARRYPHIYGPLNRDAIVEVRPAPRLPRGAFLFP